MGLTDAQIKEEIADIKRERLNLDGYIRKSRVGKSYRMNRKERKKVFALYVKEANEELDKVEANKRRIQNLGKRALACYDAICIKRDGCI